MDNLVLISAVVLAAQGHLGTTINSWNWCTVLFPTVLFPTTLKTVKIGTLFSISLGGGYMNLKTPENFLV